MRNAIAVFVVVMTLGVWCTVRARAQEESKKDASEPPPKTEPVQAYRLDFSFNELADGKIVNSRHYSMNLATGEADEIKIGTRVPVASGGSPSAPSLQYQYLDVGTEIWAQVRPRSDVLVVRSEVSNLDVSAPEHTPAPPPVVRQIKIHGETLLVTGKPIVIGSVDDPNSKRQFQLEVTVTKLR
jgi:hypothetical protein